MRTHLTFHRTKFILTSVAECDFLASVINCTLAYQHYR